jgi:hypothetical protein
MLLTTKECLPRVYLIVVSKRSFGVSHESVSRPSRSFGIDANKNETALRGLGKRGLTLYEV